jgi:hypothetical protein
LSRREAQRLRAEARQLGAQLSDSESEIESALSPLPPESEEEDMSATGASTSATPMPQNVTLSIEQFQQLLGQLQQPSKSIVKLAKPEFYDGKKHGVEARHWLQQVDRYIANAGDLSGRESIDLAHSYLSDHALEFARRVDLDYGKWLLWRTSHTTDTPFYDSSYDATTDISGQPTYLHTWKDWKDEFDRTFIDTKPELTARTQIEKLNKRSNQSGADYVVAFKNLAYLTGYNDIALLEMFKKSLDARLLTRCLEVYPQPTELTAYYKLVEDLDSALKEADRFLQRPGISSTKQDTNKKQVPNKSSSNKPSGRNFNIRPSNPISNARPSGSNVKTEDNRRTTFSCYNCGKPGHYSRNCKAPRKPNFSGSRPPIRNRAQQFDEPLDLAKALPVEELSQWTRAFQQIQSKRNPPRDNQPKPQRSSNDKGNRPNWRPRRPKDEETDFQ